MATMELIQQTLKTMHMSLKAIDEDKENRLRIVEKALDAGLLPQMGRIEQQGQKDWSLSRAACVVANPDEVVPGGEREVEWRAEARERAIKLSKMTPEARAQAETVDSKGGTLVPEQIAQQLVMARRAKSILDKLPTTKMDGLRGSPFKVLKETTIAVATYGKESTPITESDEDFGDVEGRPHELKALVKIPNGLIARSSPAIDTIIANALSKAVALKRDITGLKGLGANDEPRGVSETAGIGSFTMGTITYDKLVDMEGDLDDNDVEMQDRGYAAHPKIRRKLRQLKDNDLFPIFGRQFPLNGLTVLPVSNENLFMLNELPFAMSTQLNSTTGQADLFLGFWPDLWVMTWEGMALAATSEGNGSFLNNETHLRIIESNDFLVTRPASFIHAKDVVTA